MLPSRHTTPDPFLAPKFKIFLLFLVILLRSIVVVSVHLLLNQLWNGGTIIFSKMPLQNYLYKKQLDIKITKYHQ